MPNTPPSGSADSIFPGLAMPIIKSRISHAPNSTRQPHRFEAALPLSQRLPYNWPDFVKTAASDPIELLPPDRLRKDRFMSRRAQLEQLLAAEPLDAFLRFGLAMTCASEGDTDEARRHFEQLLADHPKYVPGYFQLAQLVTRLGDSESARPLLQTGIAVATANGDRHAAGEMTEFLGSL